MARLLVTGGAGFIGTHFVRYWLDAHPEDRLVVLDALTYAGNLANLDCIKNRPQFRFVQGDIADTTLVETLLRGESLDTLVHFAAESHVDRSIEGPDAFIQTNVVGTHSLLKAARRVWLGERARMAHRFHHVSTDEVYGSLPSADPPFSETAPYAPNSPYAASKAASDHWVRAYHHTYGLSTTISNCSNNYGPYQYPEKLMALAITNILGGKPIPVYGDGRNIRDWLFVSDHCHGIDLILKRGVPGEVYNLGGCCEVENIVLLRQLCQIADEVFASKAELSTRFPNSPAAHAKASESLLILVPDRLGHDRRYAVDIAKAAAQLGFAPRTPLTDGLRQTFEWYADRAH